MWEYLSPLREDDQRQPKSGVYVPPFVSAFKETFERLDDINQGIVLERAELIAAKAPLFRSVALGTPVPIGPVMHDHERILLRTIISEHAMQTPRSKSSAVSASSSSSSSSSRTTTSAAAGILHSQVSRVVSIEAMFDTGTLNYHQIACQFNLWWLEAVAWSPNDGEPNQ